MPTVYNCATLRAFCSSRDYQRKAVFTLTTLLHLLLLLLLLLLLCRSS
jgi:hypothetical protein